MKKYMKRSPDLQRQSGISLLMALVLLAGIMLIGVLTFTVSDTQFKQSGNQQFQATALNSAEAAISIAESWLISGGLSGKRLDPAFDLGGTSAQGLYAFQSAPFDPMVETNWTNSISVSPTQQYIIQKTQNAIAKPGFSCSGSGCINPTVNVYKIVARGTSAKGAQRIVETTYVLDLP
jgi:Tfp pilus assembly protein PilX